MERLATDTARTAPTRLKRTRPSSLAIVERGFRGTLEEQYGNIVWLSTCMRAMRANHNLLLRGAAVACAFESQQRQCITLAGLQIDTLGHFPDALRSLIARGARVWVPLRDVEAFCDPPPLLEGVEVTSDVIALITDHDKCWYW